MIALNMHTAVASTAWSDRPCMVETAVGALSGPRQIFYKKQVAAYLLKTLTFKSSPFPSLKRSLLHFVDFCHQNG